MIVTLFPFIPADWNGLDISPTNLLMFFETEAELNAPRSKNIRIKVLQRNQYDPMEILA
jgi:hypothetical protein